MNQIRLGAYFHVEDTNRPRIPKEAQVEIAKENLSRSLAFLISKNPRFFTEQKARFGTDYRAECYVLTPEDFMELRKQIEYDVTQGMPSIMGGVSVG